MQIAYGDLKARIDMVRNKTESLIVGAYMGESGIDYTVLAGKATNSVGKNVFASKPLQADHGFSGRCDSSCSWWLSHVHCSS